MFSFLLKRRNFFNPLAIGEKMPYTADAVLEFGIEGFTENKTEQRYSAVERVSVIQGKAMYVHINRMMAYLLPVASFESPEEWNRFIAFWEEKEIPADRYA